MVETKFYGISSAEWFGMEFLEFASIFVPRNGIPSCFLFRWRVQKGIPRVCFYFWSTGRNSELFSPPRKGSKRNSDNFLFGGTAGIPSEVTNYSVNSVFGGIIFLSEIPNPTASRRATSWATPHQTWATPTKENINLKYLEVKLTMQVCIFRWNLLIFVTDIFKQKKTLDFLKIL